jgi:hypothetical protein
VAQNLDCAVDGCRRQNARSLASASDVRLPQVRDEVFDVRRPDLGEQAIAEVLDDRLQPVVDGFSDRESLREDVALFVDVCELPGRVQIPRGAATARRR